MASPNSITIKSLSGKFQMNKGGSDDPDALLALQGIGWLTRKAIAYATVVTVAPGKPDTDQMVCKLTIAEYTKDNTYHIDITSVASGLSTTQEDRTLNWTDAEHSDKIFGKVIGKSRLFNIKDFDMQGPGGEDDITFLKGEKLKDLNTDSSFIEDEHVQSWAVSQGGGWTAEQIWGFEKIGGNRYHTRRVVVRKGDEVERVRLVYDYKGAALDRAKQDDDDGLAYGDE